MKRRDVLKAIPATAVLPAVLATGTAMPRAASAQVAQATEETAGGASGARKLPDYAGKMIHSDMDGLGPDGKPTGQRSTFTGSSRVDAKADTAAVKLDIVVLES